MATNCQSDGTGLRVVFVGANKNPSYVVESYSVPNEACLDEGEILMKMRMVTICQEDLNDLKMTPTAAFGAAEPRVMGHEGVGEVLRSKRLQLQKGDRIIFAKNDTCGRCEACSRGILQRCSLKQKYGHVILKKGSGLHGTFSQHVIIGAGTPVVKVPPSVSDLLASPISCAVANMIHVVRACRQCQKNVAVIQGCNMSGLFLCALLRNAGYKAVYCHDSNLDRVRLVERFRGIPVHINNRDDGSVRPQNEEADVIVNVDRSVGGISYGLQALAPGGTYILTETDNPCNNNNFTADWFAIARKSLTIKGISAYNSNDLEEAVEFLATNFGKFPFEILYGPLFRLSDFPSALKMAEKGYHLRIPVLID